MSKNVNIAWDKKNATLSNYKEDIGANHVH
jgi:hypothetical protein